MVHRAIEDIRFDAHHLPYCYLGDPQESLALGRRAKRIMDELQDPDIRKRFEKILTLEMQLIEDWCEFKKSGEEDFNKWCVNLGRNYHWIKAYYYDP